MDPSRRRVCRHAAALAALAACAPARALPTGKVRPEFRGLYPGMPATALPAALQPTGAIGLSAGYLGDDFIEAFLWWGVLSQLSIVYVAHELSWRPRIDRPLTLQEAFRMHSVGDDVPEFGFWLTHLYLVDGLIDATNLIAYKLRFAHRRYTRDAPPLFDAQTRVERVTYYRDRPDLASNYQPINSASTLKTIRARYRDSFR